MTIFKLSSPIHRLKIFFVFTCQKSYEEMEGERSGRRRWYSKMGENVTFYSVPCFHPPRMRWVSLWVWEIGRRGRRSNWRSPDRTCSMVQWFAVHWSHPSRPGNCQFSVGKQIRHFYKLFSLFLAWNIFSIIIIIMCFDFKSLKICLSTLYKES